MLSLLALSLFACSEPEPELHQSTVKTDLDYYKLEMIWLPNPHTVDQMVSLEVAPFIAGETLGWFQIEMTPYMPEHSHGLTDPVELFEKTQSTIGNWTYPMEGNWEITIDIDGPKGPDSAVLTIEVL